MDKHVYEGTSQELAPFLAQRPNRRFRLIELPEDEEQSKPTQASPMLDEKAKAAIAMLDSWIAEGQSADEATRIEAERELEDFKRNMNANRAATGERLVYP